MNTTAPAASLLGRRAEPAGRSELLDGPGGTAIVVLGEAAARNGEFAGASASGHITITPGPPGVTSRVQPRDLDPPSRVRLRN